MQNHEVPPERIPDEMLVKMAQAGDNAAFAELVVRHQSNCSKLALSILRDKSDAEDEVQNACWKAFEHIGQFQQDSKFSTWLTRIVVNQCLMRLRKLRGASFLYLDDADSSNGSRPQELPDVGLTPETELGDTELTGIVRREISRLPPILRNVLMLRDVDELSTLEVADRLSISVSAVKSRLLRARAELRTRLEKHCGPAARSAVTA